MKIGRLIFIRPFRFVSDRQEEGYWLDDAVVVVKQYAYERKFIPPTNPQDKGGDYISKYAYKMKINLWLLLIRIDWVGRERVR